MVTPLGDCGSGVLTPGATTITIPLTQTIPRSDPIGGATILVVEVFPNLNNTVHSIGVADDGATDPFYDTHIFSDGLNHYTQGPGWNSGGGALSTSFAWWGLILNPLDATNSVTITLDAVPDGIVPVMIHAFTGVNVDTSGTNWPGVSTDSSWMFSGAAVANDPSGTAADDTGHNVNRELRWEIPTGSIELLIPIAVYPDWQWLTGSLAFYNMWFESESSGRGAWTWTSGDIVTLNEFDAEGPLVVDGTTYLYQVYAEQTVSAPLVGQDISGNFAADPLSEGLDTLLGFGAILLPGPGPTWPGLGGIPAASRVFPV